MLFYFLENKGQMDAFDILYLMTAYAIVLFLSLPIHEMAHGLVAYWCGDNTAKWHGRLSLNPFRHLDLLGTIMILTVGMGYAKPVPINPRNFRHYRLDTILVSLAGPLSNFLMAFVTLFVSRLMGFLFPTAAWMAVVKLILGMVVDVNVSLMVFNLLPIPPLDGSRLWSSLLPGRWSYVLEQYSRYITLGLFLLLATHVLDIPLNFLQFIVALVLNFLTGLPFFLIDLIGLIF